MRAVKAHLLSSSALPTHHRAHFDFGQRRNLCNRMHTKFRLVLILKKVSDDKRYSEGQ